jgi:hypothetical protein
VARQVVGKQSSPRAEDLLTQAQSLLGDYHRAPTVDRAGESTSDAEYRARFDDLVHLVAARLHQDGVPGSDSASVDQDRGARDLSRWLAKSLQAPPPRGLPAGAVRFAVSDAADPSTVDPATVAGPARSDRQDSSPRYQPGDRPQPAQIDVARAEPKAQLVVVPPSPDAEIPRIRDVDEVLTPITPRTPRRVSIGTQPGSSTPSEVLDGFTVRFEEGQTRQQPVGDDLRRLEELADKVSTLARVLGHGGPRRVSINLVGYGNGSRIRHDPESVWRLMSRDQAAVQSGDRRAEETADWLRAAVAQRLAVTQGTFRNPVTTADIDFVTSSEGRGGPTETDDSRRRVDVSSVVVGPNPAYDGPDTEGDYVTGHEWATHVLKELDSRHPSLDQPTPRRPRILLSDVLAPEQHWQLFINPEDHVTAEADLRERNQDPAQLYDRQQSRGYAADLTNAYRQVLDGDLLDVGTLNWAQYQGLHQLVTGNSANADTDAFVVRDEEWEVQFGIGADDVAEDMHYERIDGRPLVSHVDQEDAYRDHGMPPLTILGLSAEHDRPIIRTRFRADEIPPLVDEAFGMFHEDIAAASTDHERLVAIARVIRSLHVMHPFRDGNGRLNVFLLLPRLLLEYGFRPTIGGDPRFRSRVLNEMSALFVGGYSLDQIATALRFGQYFGDKHTYGEQTADAMRPADPAAYLGHADPGHADPGHEAQPATREERDEVAEAGSPRPAPARPTARPKGPRPQARPARVDTPARPPARPKGPRPQARPVPLDDAASPAAVATQGPSRPHQAGLSLSTLPDAVAAARVTIGKQSREAANDLLRQAHRVLDSDHQGPVPHRPDEPAAHAAYRVLHDDMVYLVAAQLRRDSVLDPEAAPADPLDGARNLSSSLSTLLKTPPPRDRQVGPTPRRSTEWSAAREAAPAVLRKHVWTNPVFTSDPGVQGETVSSSFDVRRFVVGGRVMTDLTVRVAALDGQQDVLAGLRDSAHAGVETYLNRPGYQLGDGSVLHVSLELVGAGDDPHMVVGRAEQGEPMRQYRWHEGAPPIDLAHEIGHQIGLRDEYRSDVDGELGDSGADESTSELLGVDESSRVAMGEVGRPGRLRLPGQAPGGRAHVPGTLMGDYHDSALREGLQRGSLGDRHLLLLDAVIGDGHLAVPDRGPASSVLGDGLTGTPRARGAIYLNGQRIVSASQGISIERMHPVVAAAVNSVPQDSRARDHGACPELATLSTYLRTRANGAGRDWSAGTVRTELRANLVSIPVHYVTGSNVQCPTCRHTAAALGISWRSTAPSTSAQAHGGPSNYQPSSVSFPSSSTQSQAGPSSSHAGPSGQSWSQGASGGYAGSRGPSPAPYQSSYTQQFQQGSSTVRPPSGQSWSQGASGGYAGSRGPSPAPYQSSYTQQFQQGSSTVRTPSRQDNPFGVQQSPYTQAAAGYPGHGAPTAHENARRHVRHAPPSLPPVPRLARGDQVHATVSAVKAVTAEPARTQFGRTTDQIRVRYRRSFAQQRTAQTLRHVSTRLFSVVRFMEQREGLGNSEVEVQGMSVNDRLMFSANLNGSISLLEQALGLRAGADGRSPSLAPTLEELLTTDLDAYRHDGLPSAGRQNEWTARADTSLRRVAGLYSGIASFGDYAGRALGMREPVHVVDARDQPTLRTLLTDPQYRGAVILVRLSSGDHGHSDDDGPVHAEQKLMIALRTAIQGQGSGTHFGSVHVRGQKRPCVACWAMLSAHENSPNFTLHFNRNFGNLFEDAFRTAARFMPNVFEGDRTIDPMTGFVAQGGIADQVRNRLTSQSAPRNVAPPPGSYSGRPRGMEQRTNPGGSSIDRAAGYGAPIPGIETASESDSESISGQRSLPASLTRLVTRPSPGHSSSSGGDVRMFSPASQAPSGSFLSNQPGAGVQQGVGTWGDMVAPTLPPAGAGSSRAHTPSVEWGSGGMTVSAPRPVRPIANLIRRDSTAAVTPGWAMSHAPSRAPSVDATHRPPSVGATYRPPSVGATYRPPSVVPTHRPPSVVPVPGSSSATSSGVPFPTQPHSASGVWTGPIHSVAVPSNPRSTLKRTRTLSQTLGQLFQRGKGPRKGPR